jgi:hypothetical protein
MDSYEMKREANRFREHPRSIQTGNYEKRKMFPNTCIGQEYNSSLYIMRNLGQPATNFYGRKFIPSPPDDSLLYRQRVAYSIHNTNIPFLRSSVVPRMFNVNSM